MSDTYLIEKRREAFRKIVDTPASTQGWTEEEWVSVKKHVSPLDGTIVYHSFADYCAD